MLILKKLFLFGAYIKMQSNVLMMNVGCYRVKIIVDFDDLINIDIAVLNQ